MITWRLGPDCAAQWRDIRLAALREAPDAFEATLADWQDRPLADFARRLADAPTFAAGEVDNVPLAVAGWVGAPDPLYACLISVYARPAVRGQGYAAAAIMAVMQDAAAQGMQSIALNVRETGAHAQALYRRLGFRRADVAGLTNARGLPEVKMIRGLP